eukprot:Em0022g423a
MACNPSTQPGTKVRIRGRAVVTSGFILLSNPCVSVMGGLVEHMQKKQHVIPNTTDRGKGTGAPPFVPFKQVAKLSGPQSNAKPASACDIPKASKSQPPSSKAQLGRSKESRGVQRDTRQQEHASSRHAPATSKMEPKESPSEKEASTTTPRNLLPGNPGRVALPAPSGEGQHPQKSSLTAIAAENSLKMAASRPERGRGARRGRSDDDGEDRRGRGRRGRRGRHDDEHMGASSSKGEYQLADWFSQAMHLDAGEEKESSLTPVGYEDGNIHYEGRRSPEPTESGSGRSRGRGRRDERGRGGRRGRRGRGGYLGGREQDVVKRVEEVPYSGEGEIWPTLDGAHAPLSRGNEGGAEMKGSEVWRREKPAGKEEGIRKGSKPVAAKDKDRSSGRGGEALEEEAYFWEDEIYIWENELMYYEEGVVSEAWPSLQASDNDKNQVRGGGRGVEGEVLWKGKPSGSKEQSTAKKDKDGGNLAQRKGKLGGQQETWESEHYFKDGVVAEAWPTLQGKPLDPPKDGSMASGKQGVTETWEWVACRGVPSSAKKILS